MDKKQILEAIFSECDIDLLTMGCILMDKAFTESIKDGDAMYELLCAEDTKTLEGVAADAVGNLHYMNERENMLHAIFYRNYHKHVLGLNAVLIHDAAYEDSNGWYGWCVWVEVDAKA